MRPENYHKTLLQLLTSDQTLRQALDELIHIIEKESSGMYGSVLLMGPDKLHLIDGAAPNLPDFYRDAIDGVTVGEATGSCGTAAFTGERVIVEDIKTHPYWADFKTVALSANLQACWSQPIKQKDTVLGTFALYYTSPQAPNESHIKLIEEAAGLAKVLIEKELSRELVVEKERALEHAKRSVEWKSRFFANMSHEIRTPLNGIFGIADLLATTKLNQQQAQYLETLNFSTSALLTVINDILEVSKINEGKLMLESTAFNLSEFISSLLMTYQIQCNETTKIIASIDKNAPVWVEGDPTRLQQILGNLLSNAVKFTAKGQIKLSVESTSQKGDVSSLIFKVKDTGIGIESDKLEKIFGQYEQADYSTTRQFGGTGLGLYICEKLARLFGGKIWAESKPGEGSTFYLSVKLKKTKAPFESVTLKKVKTDYSGTNILLIEDNAVNVAITSTLLRRMNANVTISENGQQGVAAFCTSNKEFDLILMDCEMPIMDGYQATQIIRKWESSKNQNNVPICALTAHAMEEQIKKCLLSGMDYHLSKPITKIALESTLAEIFNKQDI